jgi:hypothetical protein
MYYVQHYAMLLVPLYLASEGGPFTLEPFTKANTRLFPSLPPDANDKKEAIFYVKYVSWFFIHRSTELAKQRRALWAIYREANVRHFKVLLMVSVSIQDNESSIKY